ncbi:uncharacterized protein [Nicotiana tomentosiformis]|uniref:uncharacterized protein n=1 Tax=Nicotiana tomentosiformis TaxID=4098 RepID=UPI00388C5973
METALSNINGKIWLFIDDVVEWELLIDIDQLELWDNLYYLASDMELPWLVGGDFHVILNEEEKIGGLPVYPPEYEDFAFCVNSCELFDTGHTGSPFTWWNGRANEECIFKRLDTIFVNQQFNLLFPRINVEHLIRTGYDHAPLLMTCGEDAAHFIKPFRFLNFWTTHESFNEVVKQNSIADFQLTIREDIVRIKEMLFEEEPTTENRIVLQQAQVTLKRYLSFEVQYWKQKESMKWFAEGDRNTTFFHNHVNGKRQKLQLKRIQNANGDWHDDQKGIGNAATTFFQAQFTEEGQLTNIELQELIMAISGPESCLKNI